jgi:hypothetical protein
MRLSSKTQLTTIGLLLAGAASGAIAENSGGFRGPQRNGIFVTTGLMKKWPEGGPKLLWEAGVGKGWTAASVADGKVFFFRGAGAVWADTGEKFWVDPTVKVKNRGQVQIVSNEGYIFLHGTVMAKIGRDGKIAPLWEGKVRISEYNISYSHTIIKDGRLFAFTPAGAVNPTAPGKVQMLDAETGAELSSLPCAAKGALALADGMLYLLDNRPGMVLIEVTKDSLREVCSFRPPLGKYATGSGVQLFTHPVIAEGRLFLRDQSKVLVYDLRKALAP